MVVDCKVCTEARRANQFIWIFEVEKTELFQSIYQCIFISIFPAEKVLT